MRSPESGPSASSPGQRIAASSPADPPQQATEPRTAGSREGPEVSAAIARPRPEPGSRVRSVRGRLSAALAWRARAVVAPVRWVWQGLGWRSRVFFGRGARLAARLLLVLPRAFGRLYLVAYAGLALINARRRARRPVAVPPPGAGGAAVAAAGRRPRVLIVTPYKIHPPNHGSGVRLFNLIRRLAGECDLYLLIFDPEGEDPREREALEPFVRRLVFHRWEPSFQRRFWGLDPPNARLFASPRVAMRIQDLVFTHGIDVVQLEFAELGQYANGIRGARVVLTEIDVAFRQLASRRRAGFHRSFPEGAAFGSSWSDLVRLLRYEVRVCRRVDQLHMMSAADAGHLAPFLPDGARRMRVVPNAVDSGTFRPPKDAPERRGLLYVGNFQHLPNVDALEYFLLDVWPLIRLDHPRAELTVAGAHPPPRVRRLDGAPGVTVVGAVPDLRPCYHGHRLLVAPIRAGSGTRLKILEAFASGLPVVSTALGAEGIEAASGRHLLIADEPAAFARAVGRLLDDDDLCRRLAAEAMTLARRRYDWARSAAAALAGYRELIASPPTEDSSAPPAGEGNGRVLRLARPPGRSPAVHVEVDASVVIPTRNGGERLRAVLEAVAGQRFAGRREVVLVDSGSRAAELAMMQASGARVESIEPASFDHGLTRDLGARLARGRVLVFLNQDAVPGDEGWLARLTEPLLTAPGRRAAVQGGIRDVEDPGARFYWDSCGSRFYFTRETRHWLGSHGGVGFSTVNAAIRRDVWERIPFGWAPIMEDKKWQAEALDGGWRIVARDDAFVYHTHDYDLAALLCRCRDEGYGWRLLGERYGLGEALRDALRPGVYADLVRGLEQRRVRSAAEFFFPLLRPLALYGGNRWARGVSF